MTALEETVRYDPSAEYGHTFPEAVASVEMVQEHARQVLDVLGRPDLAPQVRYVSLFHGLSRRRYHGWFLCESRPDLYVGHPPLFEFADNPEEQ